MLDVTPWAFAGSVSRFGSPGMVIYDCQQLCLGLAEVCSFGLPSSMQEGIIVPSVVAPTWCYRVWLVRGCGVLPRCRQPAGNAGPVHTSAPQTYFRHSAL